MDVLAQALNVAEEAEEATGSVALTFDLRNASHRAAYAAALAVLRISGEDEDELIALSETPPGTRVAAALATPAAPAVSGEDGDTPGYAEPLDEGQAVALRKGYLEALTELTQDEGRRDTVARETFPRVVELLRDGANVEAVAQIQYRRWVEDHLDAVR